MGSFKIIDTTADIGIIAFGKNLEDLFVEAAKGCFYIMYREIGGEFNLNFEKEVKVEGIDLEELMVNWLNELIYLNEVEEIIPIEINIKLSKNEIFSLNGVLKTQKNLKLKKIIEIKAVTFHKMKIKKEKNIWKAFIIFDI